MLTQCTSLRAPHQVHDVLGHVVLTVGDVDLGAEHLVGAVGLRLGAAAHHRQVGTRLRFGQVHGAGPLATDELFQVGGFQLIAASGEQRFNGAVGEQRTQRKAHVGRVQHFAAGRAYGLGQALTAEVGRVLQALPSALGVLAVGVAETRRGGDLAVVEAGRVLVALPVQRRNDFLVQASALFQHRLGRVQTGFLETGQLGHLFKACQMLDGEHHVFDGGDVAHACVSGD